MVKFYICVGYNNFTEPPRGYTETGRWDLDGYRRKPPYYPGRQTDTPRATKRM